MKAEPRTELTTLTEAELDQVSGGAAVLLVIYAGLFVSGLLVGGTLEQQKGDSDVCRKE
jgi:bacteriocin-like protein